MTHQLIGNHADLATAIDILDEWIKRTMFSHHQPGLAIGIVYDGDLLWGKGYGYADMDNQTPVTLDTRFRIASISKTFTALAILQLRDAGKLSLDEPVVHYLDWYPYRYQDEPLITIRNLLSHIAGLPRDAHKPMWTGLEAPTWDEFLAVVEQRQPTRPPNSHYAYSNFGYALLGAIIKEVSGQTWSDYVQEHIINRLGMSQTYPTPSPDDSGLANGYSRMNPDYEREEMPFFLLNAFEASANFASTLNDLVTYANLHLSTGDNPVISPHSLRDMHRVHWLFDSWNGGYGLGIEVSKIGDYVVSGHSGAYPGYLTQFTVCREHQTGVIVLTNAIDSNSRQTVEKAYQLVLPEILKATRTHSTADPAWERYVGHYEDIWETKSVVIRNGQLQVISIDALHQPPSILEPTDDPHTFIINRSGHSNETVRFDLDDEGQVNRMHYRNEVSTRRS